MNTITLLELRAKALALVDGAETGSSLDAHTAAIVGFSVRISVTAMDTVGASEHAQSALTAGATTAELHEALMLVSGLGVHSLFEGSRLLAALEVDGGSLALDKGLSPELQAIWDKRIGADKYWAALDREVPGFLQALLRQSPDGFDAFIRYCAVPWKSGLLPALTKELISMAVDATPTHRYLPGMRLHLLNALQLGAGRTAVLQTLEIAAQAPLHSGVR